MTPSGLIIIHQFRPITGGAELQAERLARKLIGLGHHMQILTQWRTPDSPLEENLQGLEVHRVKFLLTYWIKHGVVDTFRYLVGRRQSYDIMHVQHAFGHAVVAVVVARCFKKKCIIKIACAGSFGDLNVFSQFDGFRWALRILHQADRMIAISREIEAELITWGFSPRQIAYIPNGVDTDYFKRRQPFPDRKIVHFVLIGRRHPQKGIDIILKAVQILLKQGLGHCFDLQLFGRDFPDYDYCLMAEDLGVQGWVKFCPHSESMLQIYHSAHCLVLPSRGEGLANSLLEAMAMELAVIATQVSGTVDVVEHEREGLLVSPNSAEAVAHAMSLVIHNPELALTMGQNARLKVIQKFSLDSVAKQYSELYEELSLS
ncbi:MAG: glycosyltransferase family 1 protein [Deltaproteobacteria bacterium]|nr:glycosyltransferase family 1 protein [Deltaproteobacteria bacterium]